MSAAEYVIMVGMIIVGLLFFVMAQTFIFGGGREAKEYGYKAEGEEIVSLIERITNEPSEYVSYCQYINLCNISVKNGIFTYSRDGSSYSFSVPKNVNDTNLIDITSICIVKRNSKVNLFEELSCTPDSVCMPDECQGCCPDCYGPNPICIGDNSCDACIGENCYNSEDCLCGSKVCCPSSPDADEKGCSNIMDLSKGEECWCDSQCAEGLKCNPTINFEEYLKACCEPGKFWNGSECIFPHEGDVLIVALKSNLKEVYSDAQIKKLENKIEEYRKALRDDTLTSLFLYLDEDMISQIIGSKVTNPHDWNNIDGILDQLIPKTKAKYLVIIGGYERFPQAPIGSSQGSDDPYGDFSPKDYLPEIPVGRFPDPNNGDLDVILNALDTAIELHKSGGLVLEPYIAPIMACGGIDNRPWNSGRCFCLGIWNGSCKPCGNCCGCIDKIKLSGKKFTLILAHGPGPSSHDLLKGGCLNEIGTTWMSSLDLSKVVWMVMSCGGGHLRLKATTSGSIAMTFLKEGGAVYFGSTDSNYGDMDGCPVLGGDSCIGSLYAEVATRFAKGKRIGDAYREGKNYYFNNYVCHAGTSYQAHINCLYGDPTLKIKSMW